MANHGQQLCLAKPRGEPCANPRQTQHPCMPELPNCICFDCCEWLLVRWVSALLAAAAVPLVPAGGVWRKFKVPGDFQYPPAGSVLCAFCTQPAHGDEPSRSAHRPASPRQAAAQRDVVEEGAALRVVVGHERAPMARRACSAHQLRAASPSRVPATRAW